MRWDDLYIAGTGVCLPPPISTATAVEQGWYAQEDAEEDELAAALVADERSAPEMAVAAGRQALERSGRAPSDVVLTLHANIYHQGQDFWTPASYVQRFTVGGNGLAIQIQQGSNGGMAALEMAAAYLASAPGRTAALVTTADKYCLPGFDRWNSDTGQVYSDGATAVLLSRRAGFARLRAMVSTSDPELEEVCRDTEGFSAVPHQDGKPLDLRGRKKRYVKDHGYEELLERLSDGARANVRRTLAAAESDLDGIARVVLPNLGRTLLEWEFLEPLGIPLERTVWEWGRHVSHLGPGDQFAGLDHLVVSGRVHPGDRVLLVGVGIGFNWTSAVVEIESVPAWSGTDRRPI
ncbi:ketoacyl-ACP synthase III family protein [Streptantibioticus ferralitis]|uniref:Ketoacyl-ACP synthase III family protein n=1 Tax=Streptantibioticus ferralitis TaxID=236510 RepID=A0ABT5Z2G0_9ACTN|nr:ketoacyl-ACP synthase III family protein [Streptantibioticus ferralitis]MDF2257761.1 ketoacyl-ACP synthase III family protein [Streptantibioticus ferralitis]